ncbi:MAG: aldo/keto reductase [Nitrospirales bacterium]|nr:aldo/keto reductase [Nitrospirales bacterium]
MSMSEFYGPIDEQEATATLHRALERGVTFFDTADIYGQGHNETFVGKVLSRQRDNVVLATKFGIVRDAKGAFIGVNGRPDYVRAACEASLRRLGVEVIDLYYQHRVDPNTPIEETVGAMADLVREGKVRHLGLSEAGVQTIQKAHAVFPVAALQTEYSLWSRDPEKDILPMCRALGIGFVPYSPLGRGFLAHQIIKAEDLGEHDSRRNIPRFQGENLTKNLELVAAIETLAKAKGCQPAQLALAWVIGQNDESIPIPGTTKPTHLEENLDALAITLSSQELDVLNDIAPVGVAQGTRYTEWGMQWVNL